MTDERKGKRVMKFIECLRHTKGEFTGSPLCSPVAGTIKP